MLRSILACHRKFMFGFVLVACLTMMPRFAIAQTENQETKKTENTKTDAAGKNTSSNKNEVMKITWSKLAEAKELDKNSSLDTVDKETVLKIVREASTPQLIPVVTLKEPKIKEKAYVLKGRVRVEGIVGDGFIEMWNHFPAPKPGAYFSRTMAETGPMGKLRGTAPWREFTLPFMISDESFPAPNKLQVNVFLPDKGTVWFSDLTLEEMPLAKMQSELQGAVSLPSWFWTVLIASTILPIFVGVMVYFVLAKLRSRELGTELRRMKALDLG